MNQLGFQLVQNSILVSNQFEYASKVIIVEKKLIVDRRIRHNFSFHTV